MAPKITLYFLQASRSIRTAWLLHDLNLDYDLKFAPRENGAAPAAFKREAGGLGKFPMLADDGLTIAESGNITERYAVLQWIHASEATFMIHGLAILYALWFQKSGNVKETEAGLAGNVQKDLEWFEHELAKSGGKFLLGDEITAADVSMHFSLSFILARELGIKGKRYERTEQYVKDCESVESFKAAVKKTGHQL